MLQTFLRKYNTATASGTHIRIPLVKRGVLDQAVGADWTPAAGDVKVSTNGDAAANITTLPTAVAMGNTAYWEFQLSATELSCAELVVTVADSATKAVEDATFVIETFGHASAMYPPDLTNPLDALTRTLTQSYAADGAEFTVAQGLYEICQAITEFTISGTTISVKKRDGVTQAAAYTLNSSTTPTSRTRAS
jgi:hypothetical protein